MKKIISVLLSLVMLLPMVFAVNASSDEGNCGEVTVFYNNTQLSLDPPASVEGNTVSVPAKAMLTAIGATVVEGDSDLIAVVNASVLNESSITTYIIIDKDTGKITKDGNDTGEKISWGRNNGMYIPSSFFSDVLGMTVGYNSTNGALMIYSKDCVPTNPNAVYTSEVFDSRTGFGGYQGGNNWYYMEKSNNVYSTLTEYISESPAKWTNDSGYPYVCDEFFHPGDNSDAVKKWLAPKAGTVDIAGVISKADPSGDGVTVKIFKNNIELISVNVTSATDIDTFLNNLYVEAGDALYFIVNKKENAVHDEIKWAPVVTLTSAVIFDATKYSQMQGINPTDTQIESFDAGDYILYEKVDLGAGYKTLLVNLACAETGKKFEVWLDGIDSQHNGVLAGTVTVCGTEGLDKYETQPFSLNGANGIRNVYIKGVSGTNIANIRSLEFSTMEYRGATMPFRTYEAEDAALGGGAAVTTVGGVDTAAVLAEYSSHKSYVMLDNDGEYAEWTNVRPANKLTLRYSIAQGSSRGANAGTINIYINGVKKAVNVSDKYCYDWAINGVRYYDEAEVDVDLTGGETVRVQKDPDNTCGWYAIDSIDLENVPAPLQMPEGFLSITDFGATAGDEIDDASAIQTCVNEAANQGKYVWIPEGKFVQNIRIVLPDDMEVRGAGMWYTELYSASQVNWSDEGGFSLSNNNYISDMRIVGDGRGRNNSGPIAFSPEGEGCTIDNVMFRNRFTVIGWGKKLFQHMTIRSCRFIGLYCDSLHFGDLGASYNVAENNFFRGVGDDAIAQVNCVIYNSIPHDNLAQFNTMSALYAGRGMSIAGGYNTVYRDNYIDSCYNAGMYVATEQLDGKDCTPVDNCKVQRNTIIRNGHTGHNHGGFEFWLGFNDMSNFKIELNDITENIIAGLKFDIWKGLTYGDSRGRTKVNFNNIINNPVDYVNLCVGEINPVLNGNTIGTIHEENAPPQPDRTPLILSGYYRFKSAVNGQYLYDSNSDDKIRYGSLGSDGNAYQWTFISDAGSGGYFIKNRATGRYVRIEHLLDYIEIDVSNHGLSSCWKVEKYNNGKVTFRNLWRWNNLINIQNDLGYAQRCDADPSWVSAQWTLEEAGQEEPSPTPTPTPTPTPDPNATYTSEVYDSLTSFSSTQGNNGWYYMEKSIGVYTIMTEYVIPPAAPTARWRTASGYPYLRDQFFHPGSADAVKKWLVPKTGFVDITGVIGKVSTGSDGVIAKIFKNDTVLFNANITSSSDVDASINDLYVEAGDALYFEINKNGGAASDETRWAPVVTLSYQVP